MLMHCRLVGPLCLLALLSTLAAGCSDADRRPDTALLPDGGADAGQVSPDGGGARFGPLVIDTEPAEHDLDLFAEAGHRFWIEVSDDQLDAMNGEPGGFPGPFLQQAGHRPLEPAYALEDRPIDPGWGGDIYMPGDAGVSPTFADHVVIQNAATGAVADYGKVEVKLVGESTYRQWTSRTIPNVRIDSNEFQKDLRIGGYEHLRLNNGLVGSIFREHIAHRIFRGLGYPALRSTFAFLGSNVWGKSTWVPMTLTEVYKRRFCTDNAEVLGGTCTNMWEYAGDAGVGDMPPDACQVDECDDQRMTDLAEALAGAPIGAGFRDALADVIDWPLFHRFQCISWIVAAGDDALRSSNNNLIIERDGDGKLVFAPYSVDISAGQEWQPHPPLLGSSTLARGCQADPECWAGTVAACEKEIAAFAALEPERIVDETTETLKAEGMMRRGDEARALEIRQWYVQRQTELSAELERFRYLPDAFGSCPNDLAMCNDGGCGTLEECEMRRCTLGTTWCEAMQQCIDEQWQACVECGEEAPFYCPLDASCVSDIDACSRQCELINGPGWIFCPATGWCEMSMFCGEPEPLPPLDGGGEPLPEEPAAGDGGAGPDAAP